LQNISAYLGKQLSGKVLSTFVRGNLVFAEDKHANALWLLSLPCQFVETIVLSPVKSISQGSN
jgi:hypothetical protein